MWPSRVTPQYPPETANRHCLLAAFRTATTPLSNETSRLPLLLKYVRFRGNSHRSIVLLTRLGPPFLRAFLCPMPASAAAPVLVLVLPPPKAGTASHHADTPE